MNTYYISDINFLDSILYKDFIRENQGRGRLRIRAYAASQAVPIEGLKIVISTIYDDNRIVFFEGYTDSSGVIDKITLPAPKLDSDNLNAPSKTVYDIVATYEPDNIESVYEVNMYENICVVQTINIVPDLKVGGF